MSQFPSLTGKEVIKALKKSGFQLLRVRGRHHILAHVDGRRIVVPVHSNEKIEKGVAVSNST